MNTDLHLSLHELREKLAEVQEKVSALQLELPEIMHAMESIQQELPEEGTPISMTQAAQRYGVSDFAIRSWVKRGWIAVLDHGKERSGSRVLIDEKDVAYLVLTKYAEQSTPIALPIAPVNGEEMALPEEGRSITVSRASHKYQLSRQTIYDWVKKSRIRVLDTRGVSLGSGLLVNERDVALNARNKGKGRRQRNKEPDVGFGNVNGNSHST